MDRFISMRNGGRWQGYTLACGVLLLFVAVGRNYGQSVEVTLRVEFAPGTHTRQLPSAQFLTVAWLMPLGVNAGPAPPLETHTYQMVQKDKM